ncbi:MAG: hypothetical protein OXU69_16235 [Gemmatimonadota bacterium]|nr:hypothetical protein [Gemmatimonadota bacterium]
MRTRFAPLACLAVPLALTACGDAPPAPDADPTETPEVAAVLDWIEDADMEFGAAPFSPPGWPYRIGEEIDYYTRLQLNKRFGSFNGIWAVNWVDGRAFGAIYNHEDAIGRDHHAIYEGHLPKKTSRGGYERSKHFGTLPPMPPNVRLDLVLGDRFESAAYAVLDSVDVLRARWHEPFLNRGYGGDGKR